MGMQGERLAECVHCRAAAHQLHPRCGRGSSSTASSWSRCGCGSPIVELIEQLTVQKNAAEKARETAESANIAKSRFLAAASHDLRQPDSRAEPVSRCVRRSCSWPHPTGSLLGKVRQCALIMDNMFRTLLDVSKLDAGAVNPQITRVRAGAAASAARDWSSSRRPARRDSSCGCTDARLLRRATRRWWSGFFVTSSPTRSATPTAVASWWAAAGVRGVAARVGVRHRHRHRAARAVAGVRGVLSGRQSGARSVEGPGARARHRRASGATAATRAHPALATGPREPVRLRPAARRRRWNCPPSG